MSKYTWWILGALVLLFAAVAALLLRKPAAAPAVATGTESAAVLGASTAGPNRGAALLNVLKEELFALESEKLSGTLSSQEYQVQKSALETVLKRALKRSS
jgi:hypothetical protein